VRSELFDLARKRGPTFRPNSKVALGIGYRCRTVRAEWTSVFTFGRTVLIDTAMPRLLKNQTCQCLEVAQQSLRQTFHLLATPRPISFERRPSDGAIEMGLVGVAAELALVACLHEVLGKKPLHAVVPHGLNRSLPAVSRPPKPSRELPHSSGRRDHPSDWRTGDAKLESIRAERPGVSIGSASVVVGRVNVD